MGLFFKPAERVFDFERSCSRSYPNHDGGLYRGFRWLVGRQSIQARAVSQIHAIQPIRQIAPKAVGRSPDKCLRIGLEKAVSIFTVCGWVGCGERWPLSDAPQLRAVPVS